MYYTFRVRHFEYNTILITVFVLCVFKLIAIGNKMLSLFYNIVFYIQV